ncbi:MAG: hypothetical protein KatS3mg038_1043 [Candidatus Kapaibacterium sp.]|nr:MAG: hypothetical protein KatS3mg038_1043 [Candidatus Kapabacteria bacterium]
MFPTELSAAQLNRLRGAGAPYPSWRGTVYLTLCPNDVVWETTVSASPAGSVYAAVPHGATLSGSAANVQPGMTVLISSDNDMRNAYWRGRVRAPVSSGLLPINETSVPFQAGNRIWVLDDYALHVKLARDTGTAYYKDWDRPFSELPPVIYNLQSAYVGFVAGSPLGLTIAFNTQAYAATQGATITSWQWTVPSGVVLVAGSSVAPNPTYRFPPGFAGWISVAVTDNAGRTARRRIFVAAHDRDAHAPRSGFASVNINAELESGYNATLTAFDPSEFADVLDGTLAILWIDEAYNGEAGPLLGPTANILCVGRLRRETIKTEVDEKASFVTTSDIEIEGFAAQLSRLHAPKIAIRNASAPSAWDEIRSLTLWRAVVHVLAEHSTFLDLCSLTFDSQDNTFRLMQLATQEGNLLSCVNDIMESINARLEFAPDGTARCVRNPRYLDDAARSALPVAIAFDAQDVIDVSVTRTHISNIGRCEASGGVYNGANNSVEALLSLAPGHAQDEGDASTVLARQVLAADVPKANAQQELNARCGHHLEAERKRVVLDASHPDGYAFMVPSNAVWYTFELDIPIRGISYSSQTRWTCNALSMRFDENGAREVRAVYHSETRGTPGRTVTHPPPGAIPFSAPEFPPLPAYPGIGIVEPLDPYLRGAEAPVPVTPSMPARMPLQRNGNTVAIWTASRLFYTTQFLTGGPHPVWTEITPPVPSGGSIRSFVWDAYNETGAYCLIDDGTDTTLYYTPDVRDEAWMPKATLQGIYTVLRLGNAPGKVAAFAPRVGSDLSGTFTWTATFDPGGASYTPIAGSLFPGGRTGNCWGFDEPAGPHGYQIFAAKILIPLPPNSYGVHVAMYYKKGPEHGGATIGLSYGFLNAAMNPIPGRRGGARWPTPGVWTLDSYGSREYAWMINVAAYADFLISWERAAGEPRAAFMDDCTVTFESTLAVAGARSAAIGDYGTNVSYGSVGGTSVGVGACGFALQRVGTYTYGGINGRVRGAPSPGGAAYSDSGPLMTGAVPRLLFIPTHVFGSTSSKNTGSPASVSCRH